MFGCCCQEAGDAGTQVVYNPTAEDSQGIAFANTGVASGGGAQSSSIFTNEAAAPTDFPPGQATSLQLNAGNEHEHTARSEASLSPEEKQKEKERLQDLVKGFARRAVRGIPCTYIQLSSGEQLSRQYYVDRKLENLVIASHDTPVTTEVRCPIVEIQDIYCIEDGEDCFPTEVIDRLRPEDKDMLLMVVYRSGREGNALDALDKFCFLEKTQASRECFLTCMRILRLYSQGSGAKAT